MEVASIQCDVSDIELLVQKVGSTHWTSVGLMSNAYDLLVGTQRLVTATLRVQPGRRDQTIEQQRQQLVAAWSRFVDELARIMHILLGYV